MSSGNNWQELKSELRTFSIWGISSLIDSGFLAIWVLIQWFVNEQVISKLELSGLDGWVLSAFQIIFAISTLAPVAIYTYVDIRIMIMRAQKRLQNELQLSEVYEE